MTVYKTEFTPMRHALPTTGQLTSMKLVCIGKNEKLVGLHMVRVSAAEMLQGFAVAVEMGATKADLDRTIAIHPGSAEKRVTLKTPISPAAEIEWKEAG